jgi:hypothetical protein
LRSGLRLLGQLCWLPVVALLACTDAQLYHLQEVPNLPNKVAFTGTVCTDNPAERNFPLKVVYVVDTSAVLPPGLNGTQAALLASQRAQAVRDSVTVLRGTGTEFALVRFGGTSQLAPEGGFTANSTDITAAAGALSVALPGAGEGQRRTLQALQLASSLITGDLLSQPKGPRSRTKYVIALIQAGPAEDATLNNLALDPNCDRGCVLTRRVEELRDAVLDDGAADFQLHAIDLTPLGNDPALRAQAEDELTRMAFAGAGEYKQVCRRDPNTDALVPPGCGPQNLNLLGVDIKSARNVLVTKSFVVANINARHTDDGVIPDSDGDGLPDEDEDRNGDGIVQVSLCDPNDDTTFCATDADCVGVGNEVCNRGETDPTTRDSDGDGIGDKVEQLLSTVGLNPLAVDAPVQCAAIINPQTTDTDGDGLTDCEEALLRMDSTLFDTDADGMPDLLEFLAGTNFLEGDMLADADFDGVSNANELRAHSDARTADAISRAELSYLYREVDLGIREHRFSSQPRDVSGVVVQNVSVDTSIGNGTLVYLLEDPPVLAWRDPEDGIVGEGVRLDGDGVYKLRADCVATDDGADAGPRSCDLDRSITVAVTTALLPPFPVDEILRISVAERQCTDFRVRNVTLVETLAANDKAIGTNDVRIYFGQVPQDKPDTFGIFRVASYEYQHIAPLYKDPDIADQPVDSFRFVLFGD